MTKEEKVTLHALDTLNVSRNVITGRKQNEASLADVFDAIGLKKPVDGQEDLELPF